jgi:hypothetical protein
VGVEVFPSKTSTSVIIRIRLIGLAGFLALAGNCPAGDPDRSAMTTAAPELARQMNFFQEFFGTNDRLKQLNGLFQQTMDFQAALIEFRQAVTDTSSREATYVAFDPVDRQLAVILFAVRDAARADPVLKMVCGRLRAAETALHSAVFSADATPARVLEQVDRQAVDQQAFIESLGDNTSWMFADPAVTKGRPDDLGEVRQAVAAIQQLGKKKATVAALKDGVARADKAWGKVMQRYEDSKQYKPALRGFVARLDQGFARLSQLTGVKV